MTPQRLVTFVEGRGDVAAVPTLVRRVLNAVGGTDVLFVDPDPFRVDGLGPLVKNNCHDWHRFLAAAGRRSRPAVRAVLLVLDGEADPVPRTWQAYVNRYGSPLFCARRVAAELAHAARADRAGDAFSLAVTLAVPEFEAWLLAGVEGLRGVRLSGGRGTIGPAVDIGDLDVERHRDGKGRLRVYVPAYSPGLDQGALAGRLDVGAARQRSRSFRRLWSALDQLVSAVRTGQPCVTPALPA